ncbi:L,D-transpeptidase (plasmid) [Pontibacillus sp. ALD_SL1]|uniref:L,D-transpeptidase n=1 Tax=Pontibacillus sp. ALD_SL1 TaxID=2777185 RepID=UPI001A971457|nr:L,D-transpeptidase [Pontibacillus sp. ALD_SL1]QST02890.1 L,D-transpeptidase [Pontibacillus sp. ALD_SL1]
MKKDHVIEVIPHVFLSPSDRGFYRKYLHYRPHDTSMMIQYARVLQDNGNMKEAEMWLQKAAERGSTKALSALSNLRALSRPSPQPSYRKRSIGLVVFLLALFLFIGVLIGTHFHSSWYRTSHQTLSAYEDPTVTDEELTVVSNALMRYHQQNGRYPYQLNDLVSPFPYNYLSHTPESLYYTSSGGSYTLTADNRMITEEDMKPLSIYVSTESRLLYVRKGKTILASYPVSVPRSGTPIPFQETIVTKRVAFPNGGEGVLGTRGFELEENIAIHGTDSPSSIGSAVTGGCIRLSNADIENVFPYISIGTPVTIGEEPLTSEPLHGSGLPPLSTPFTDHDRTEEVFAWRE